jgi:thiamine biosynthesis lipoprotein
MGTMYNVKAVRPGGIADSELRRIRAGIERLLVTVNDQMSTYQRDSEISMFNKSGSTEWFDLSPATAEILSLATDISGRTEGAFDITVGPLVNLWGFGPEKKEASVPSDDTITLVRQEIGYGKLSVRLSPPSAKKSTPGLYCDLAAIAKGYAVDWIAAYLDSAGVHDYLVEIGGEVRTAGCNESGEVWQVGIATPDNDLGVQTVVALRDASMATSGDYRNFFEFDGVRYSHTIDPRTGYPVRHQLASVSVIHDSCAVADAFATALEVLGPEEGLKLAREQNLAACFIIRTETGLIEEMTPTFRQYLSP